MLVHLLLNIITMKEVTIIQLSKKELESTITSAIDQAMKRTNEKSMHPNILTVQQAAKYIGLKVPTVYNYTSKGLIPHRKKGKRLIFVKEELDKWLLDP
jgi:excisionase family DNA binding protein